MVTHLHSHVIWTISIIIALLNPSTFTDGMSNSQDISMLKLKICPIVRLHSTILMSHWLRISIFTMHRVHQHPISITTAISQSNLIN